MVQKTLLSDRQREEIKAYFGDLPRAMPDYVRGIRAACKKIDLKQIEEDLKLVRILVDLELPIGRRKNNYQDRMAKFVVRRVREANIKGVLRVRRS